MNLEEVIETIERARIGTKIHDELSAWVDAQVKNPTPNIALAKKALADAITTFKVQKRVETRVAEVRAIIEGAN